MARQSSHAGRGGDLLWYMRERWLPVGKPYDHEPSKYFIDLVSGRWLRWGTRTWCDWEQGPWHELVEQPEPTPPPSLEPFVASCLAAGFTLCRQSLREHCLDGVDLGSRWVERGGERYLAHVLTRTLIDRKFTNHVLEEFTRPPVNQSPTPSPRPTATQSRPVPREAERRPLVHSGANQQGSLF